MKLLLKFLLAVALPFAMGSALIKGLKGGGEVHGEFHREVKDNCHTEYDDVWEEKCTTVYEDKCELQHKKQCTPTTEQVCSVHEQEKCDYVPSQKCTSIPIPKCSILWEKSCVKQPRCVTHHDKECHIIQRDKCHIEHEKSCKHVTETVCKNIRVQLEQAPVEHFGGKGEKAGKGDKGSKHDKFAGKGHLEKGGSKFGGQHEADVHESGHESEHGHESGHNLHRRDAHKISEFLNKAEGFKDDIVHKTSSLFGGKDAGHNLHRRDAHGGVLNSTQKLSPYDAYLLHKASLEALRTQIGSELKQLEKVFARWNITNSSNDTSDVHGIQKRSVDQKVFELRKRSLNAIEEQIQGEMEILERSDLGRPDDADDASYAAVNRQRRTVNGKAIMDSPQVQQMARPVKGKGETGAFSHASQLRMRRSLKGLLFGKGEEEHGGGGYTFQKECWEEPREKCVAIPRQVCIPEESEVCKDIPKEICTHEDVCKDIPKKDCRIEQKEVCANIPTRQCHTVPRQVCKEVEREICQEIPHEVCSPVPGKKCEKVEVKRPRVVCLPPQKVRVLEQASEASEYHGESSREPLY